MINGKRKIIQKRVKKRERYARMARIRYRKEKNVPLAKFECLPNPVKLFCSTPNHNFYLDLSMIEDENGLATEFSLFNKTKICNSISLMGEDDKLLYIKFCHNHSSEESNWRDVVNSWKNRNDAYWNTWANRIQDFSLSYENFIQQYNNKILGEEVFDKKLVQRQNEYLAKRNKLIQNNTCAEIRFRFEDRQMRASEVYFTSKYLARLGFGMEEFLELVFREGLPQQSFVQNNGIINVIEVLMDNFDQIFTQDFELLNQEITLVTKNQTLKKTKFNAVISGFFNKKLPEIAVLFSFDESQTALKAKSSIEISSQVDIEKALEFEKELKDFIDRYYSNENLNLYIKNEETCQIKPVDPLEEEDTNQNIKIEFESKSLQNEKTSNKSLFKTPAVPPSFYPNLTSSPFWITQNTFHSQLESIIRFSRKHQLDYPSK